MASILPFIREIEAAFDDHATWIMGEAFAAACKELHDKGQPQIVDEVIGPSVGVGSLFCGTKKLLRNRHIIIAPAGQDALACRTGDGTTAFLGAKHGRGSIRRSGPS
jgi:hypothetical protein